MAKYKVTMEIETRDWFENEFDAELTKHQNLEQIMDCIDGMDISNVQIEDVE